MHSSWFSLSCRLPVIAPESVERAVRMLILSCAEHFAGMNRQALARGRELAGELEADRC